MIRRARTRLHRRKPALLRLTPADLTWRVWLEHARALGRDDVAEAAARAGEIEVPTRWPQQGAPLPRLTREAMAAARAAAIIGEARE